MKLYIANGQYAGTQADAKRLDKHFVEAEVPTDKPGLIAYLNGLSDRAVLEDPDRVVKDVNEDIAPERAVSYTDRTIQIDEVFGNLPIEHQLTLTSLALENARTEIGKLKGVTVATRSWCDTPSILVEDDDDGLFS